jgi:hypothetical protein
VDKLSIYVMWASCLFMSCGQVVYLCHVNNLFTYVMWSNYLFYVMCTNFLFFTSINYLSISCMQLSSDDDSDIDEEDEDFLK